jgi:hypothetical protein
VRLINCTAQNVGSKVSSVAGERYYVFSESECADVAPACAEGSAVVARNALATRGMYAVGNATGMVPTWYTNSGTLAQQHAGVRWTVASSSSSDPSSSDEADGTDLAAIFFCPAQSVQPASEALPSRLVVVTCVRNNGWNAPQLQKTSRYLTFSADECDGTVSSECTALQSATRVGCCAAQVCARACWCLRMRAPVGFSERVRVGVWLCLRVGERACSREDRVGPLQAALRCR